MRRITIAITALVFLLAAPLGASAESPQDILIIVNKSAGVKKVSVNELRDVFLKKRASWSVGGKVIPVHASEGSALRDDFRRKVLNMSSADEKKYWQDKKIKSGDSKPAEFGDTQRAVFKLRGAVSYIYRSQFKEGSANIVLVLPAG